VDKSVHDPWESPFGVTFLSAAYSLSANFFIDLSLMFHRFFTALCAVETQRLFVDICHIAYRQGSDDLAIGRQL
jgi:hypothetical protein